MSVINSLKFLLKNVEFRLALGATIELTPERVALARVLPTRVRFTATSRYFPRGNSTREFYERKRLR